MYFPKLQNKKEFVMYKMYHSSAKHLIQYYISVISLIVFNIRVTFDTSRCVSSTVFQYSLSMSATLRRENQRQDNARQNTKKNETIDMSKI